MPEFAANIPRWNDIPQMNITGNAIIADNNCVVIPTQVGEMSISMLDEGIRIQMGKTPSYDYKILKQNIQAQTVSVAQSESEIEISNNQFKLVINTKPFHFSFYNDGKRLQRSAQDGHFVRQFRLPPLAKTSDGWLLFFELESSEPIYGLGEKWSKLDKRGQLIRSFNHDALGVNAEISYKNTPFAWSPLGWGVFVHTPAPVTHAVGYAPWSHRAYGVLVEDESLDIFLLAADSGADMLYKYTALTGRAPVPPDWSLGVILSKAYYKNAEEILETAKDVRRHKMPCDVITLDGRAWQDTNTRFAFEWDPNRYNDPAALIAQIKNMHFKVCVWEYPLVSVRHPLFEFMAEKGWLIKDSRTGLAFRYHWDLSAFGEVLTPLPESGIVDFTHPDAYKFWRDSHKPLFDIGVDMIKADFGEQIENKYMLAHNGETGLALHNVYALLYNRCVYEAATLYSKNGPFLFSRSSWTGSQCYPAQWGGDPQADWGGLAASLRGGLSWGLSGASYYATDIGGFYKDTRDAELFVRWAQAAVFSSHMRLHGIGQREPWSYGADAEQAVSKILQLRYRLLPYIKQSIEQAHQSGLPLQRAMVLAFPDDPAAWAFEHQFMFGDDLLVVPCLSPDGKVQFYLPEGDWFQFEGNHQYTGNKVHKLSLKLDEIAVFALRGTRIPMIQAIEHTDELPDLTPSAFWQAE